MILTKAYNPVVYFVNSANKCSLYRCFSSTDRSESISAALKQFYLKVHPDLFTQYPKEKDVNEKSLQLVSAYLSGLQRKEHMTSINVTFFTKLQANSSSTAPASLVPHHIKLNSRDLLTCVNSILTALNLPTVHGSKPKASIDQRGVQFKIIEINKFYDFTEVPKKSLKTWLKANADKGRVVAKRNQKLLNEFSDKMNSIKERFHLKAIEYCDDWSVAQFASCLRTLFMYVDKWHPNLLNLQGKRLIFGYKSCLLQDGSLELSANDPPVYWDRVIGSELSSSSHFMKKIITYEQNISEYFHGIHIRYDIDFEYLSRANIYLYHLTQLNSNLNLNFHHDAHQRKLWENFSLLINPLSSEPSITDSGAFQINAFDATIDILEFMLDNRIKASQRRHSYEDDVRKGTDLLERLRKQFNLSDVVINRRLKQHDINLCCERLLNEHADLVNVLTQCRLKIDTNYSVAQNGTLSIPWNWSMT